MKWAFEHKEYYMAYILFTEYRLGIPNYLLYTLPNKRVFVSARDFLSTNGTKNIQDKYLNKIFVLFRSSKYTKLPEWDNRIGYKSS